MADGPQDQQLPEPSNFSAFDGLLGTFRRIHGALHAVVHREDRDGAALQRLLAREAMTHVEGILEGLVILGRAGQFSDDELRALVRRVGIVESPMPGSADARAAASEAVHDRARLRTIDGRTMLAAGHARVVFSMIPSVPADAVSWPREPRSYADIPVPRSAGEMLLRTEELGRVVWRVAAGDEHRDEALRRTLAFYEAGARLSFRGGFRAA